MPSRQVSWSATFIWHQPLLALALLLTTVSLSSQIQFAAGNELRRILERNRGAFVVEMEEEDYPKVLLQISKYECHSLFSGAPCTYMVGGGFEQSFPTTTTPPHANSPQRMARPAMTKHIARGHGDGTVAQNIIVEALARQFLDESRFVGDHAVNPEGDRAMIHTDDTSLIDAFQDPALHRSLQDQKELQKDQTSRLFDDKHDTDVYAILKKRQRFSHYVLPDDPIVTLLPSHSGHFLGKQLGDFQKQKAQFHAPSGIVTRQPPATPPIKVSYSENGDLVIEASLDLHQYLPVDGSDPVAVQEYLINMPKSDLEAMKSVMAGQIRHEMEDVVGIDIDDNQVKSIVDQMHAHFEKVIRDQQQQARTIKAATAALLGKAGAQITNADPLQQRHQQHQQQEQQFVLTEDEIESLLDPSTVDPEDWAELQEHFSTFIRDDGDDGDDEDSESEPS